MGAGNTEQVSRVPSKLAGPGALRARPPQGFPHARGREHRQHQVLPRLVPDAMTILDGPVGALEQLIHSR